MNEQHIHSAYDRDLEALQAMIVKMGGLVESGILQVGDALIHRDVEAAEKIRAADKRVDELEELINQEAARVIALRAPMGNDLRALLAVIKISADLERIGDYTKNIAKRISAIVESSPINGSTHSLSRMAREVELMLKDVLDAYIQRDEALAEDVRSRDEGVDQMYNALFRGLLTHMMEDPRHITPCMHLHFIAKNIERMGDHVTNVAEQIIYLATGSLPEDGRQKADNTSFVSANPS